MSDHQDSGHSSDDMAEYLQAFLDETEEQLDSLVETMLALERDSTNRDELNEAFRLIHSIKGSSGIMGFDNIAVLTHQLENRFERFRSGADRLDEPTMNLVLRCIDFLRQCSEQLRRGGELASGAELLDELRLLDEQSRELAAESPDGPEDRSLPADTDLSQPVADSALHQSGLRIAVGFRPDLLLADLKAQLIVARLSALGEVKSTYPDLEELAGLEGLERFEVRINTPADVTRLREAVSVEGVETIEIGEPDAMSTAAPTEAPEHTEPPPDQQTAPESDADDGEDESGEAPAEVERPVSDSTANRVEEPTLDVSGPAVVTKSTTRVAETMRVDIDRLDNLVSLAGELVVNRARFVQIQGQVSPALRKASVLNRVRDFTDSLRRTIESLEGLDDTRGEWTSQIQQLQAGIELLDEQAGIWDDGRRSFGQIGEAIDQLSRVSNGLQRGVLDTRMVPVGPLFSRFKRVVRDLSKERGKEVVLTIRGEKTELDKRMIDDLGDPLVHLVRNAIDHGLEPIETRKERQKPGVGTISLEAGHSGNNVYIYVRDDGGGIDVEKIKAKLLAGGHSEAEVAELTDADLLEYIWHAGFSTAAKVTDVSGRGVGMDAVKNRIHELNGTISVASTLGEGTEFTIRLPLTLAIINCLLVRLHSSVFAMPIDDVREIVSIQEREVVRIQGREAFDVRGEFVPLVSIEDVFDWHCVDYGNGESPTVTAAERADGLTEVVILQAGGRTMGLRVDEPLGSQDIVIKSLTDNFIDIEGLSGASILGDGSVCLMLDVSSVIEMAKRASRSAKAEEPAS